LPEKRKKKGTSSSRPPLKRVPAHHLKAWSRKERSFEVREFAGWEMFLKGGGSRYRHRKEGNCSAIEKALSLERVEALRCRTAYLASWDLLPQRGGGWRRKGVPVAGNERKASFAENCFNVNREKEGKKEGSSAGLFDGEKVSNHNKGMSLGKRPKRGSLAGRGTRSEKKGPVSQKTG